MARSWGWFVAVGGACVLLGCPLHGQATSDGGAADAGAAQASVGDAAADAQAANAGDVTRYPDETSINHVLAATRWATSTVWKQASSTSDVVGTVKRGTEVDKIAQKDTFYLVLFTDPSDATRTLMGWVSEEIFENEAPHRRVPVHCAPPEVAILLGGGEEACVTVCATDATCGAGRACDGSGPTANNGTPGPIVRYCRGAAHDAGASPVAVDAGGVAKRLDVKKSGGACPAGYGSCGAICRLTCRSNADCGLATAHCTGGFCLGPGAQPCH